MNVKYLADDRHRSSTYLPLLVRELARADVVHVFSASYSSFLLAPLPAMLVAHLLGKPVMLNYRSGEAPDHLRRSAIARATLRRVERNVVPSRFLRRRLRVASASTSPIIPNIVDVKRFAFRERDPLRPRLVSTRNFDALYNLAVHAARVQARAGSLARRVAHARRRRPQEAPLRELAAQLRAAHVTFAGRVTPGRHRRATTPTHDIYMQTPDIDNMPTSVLEAFASGLPVVSTEAGGVPAILTHGRHGLLAPLGDYETLASARPAAARPARLSRASSRARRSTAAGAAPGPQCATSGCAPIAASSADRSARRRPLTPPYRMSHDAA